LLLEPGAFEASQEASIAHAGEVVEFAAEEGVLRVVGVEVNVIGRVDASTAAAPPEGEGLFAERADVGSNRSGFHALGVLFGFTHTAGVDIAHNPLE
jgi:hypothetical protein